ncbi:MAG: cyclopropane-fatty-acyl-phospholipid synthase family protein [Bacteriovoracaceae bacterium]
MNSEKLIERNLSLSKSHDGVTRILKKLIFSKLHALKYGQLEIKDQESSTTFGDLSYPLKAEVIIYDSTFYIDLFTKGSVGAAEAYILKKWDSPDLNDTMALFAANRTVLTTLDSGLVNFIKPVRFLEYWKQRNTIKGSKKNIVAHYDLPDELFRLFLDETLMYSSAIYPSKDSSLYEAQMNKLRLIGERLNIKSGAKILEIGSGWGSLAVFLAQNYECHVTTTTISENQYKEVQSKIDKLGLQNKVTLLKQDYRLLEGKFDRVVSIEMIEAVGHQFLGTYLKKISDVLKDDGLALIQAITITDQEYERAVKEVDFIKKFIFPGSFIPSINAIHTEAKNQTDLRMIMQIDFAGDYARTLNDWKVRFNNRRDELSRIGLDEQFERMWNFYFSYCIGGFRERAIGVSHLQLAKPKYKNI